MSGRNVNRNAGSGPPNGVTSLWLDSVLGNCRHRCRGEQSLEERGLAACTYLGGANHGSLCRASLSGVRTKSGARQTYSAALTFPSAFNS